jgi:hypothetical protein
MLFAKYFLKIVLYFLIMLELGAPMFASHTYASAASKSTAQVSV